jgi:hypothetical protein
MRIVDALLGCLLISVMSCGSSSSPPPSGLPGEGPPPTGGPPPEAGSPANDAGGTNDAGPYDAGPPPGTVPITLTLGPFNVPAGTEVFKCQTFANPFGGVDTDIKTYEEHMTHGSHHMFVFFIPNASDGPLMDCPNGGLEFHPYPFTAQVPDFSLTYPDTVGSRVPSTMGLMLNAHFLNTGAQDFQATLTVTFHVALPGAVTQHAGVVFMNNVGITIPPGSMPQTATASCTLPQDMKVLGSGSHMHMRATQFTATANGQTLYQTTDWTNPQPAAYVPPLDLASGTSVTFACTYLNDTAQTLTFGESALTNVMCIYTMQFYPVADPSNPTIDCQTF